MPNPYSAERPASPEVFSGYGDPSLRPQGGWTLEEMTGCWLQAEGGGPSFWLVGERKLGKTSLLLRLEHLLLAQSRNSGVARIAVPLYASCKGVSSLPGFYRKLFGRVAEILEGNADHEGSFPRDIDISPFQLFLVESQAPTADLDLLDYAIRALGSLIAQISLEHRLGVRIVLLIDDVADSVAEGWASSLFEHLRALLTGRPFVLPGELCRPEDLVVVLAGERVIEREYGGGGLFEILEELQVRPLTANEVAALITDPRQIQLGLFWPGRIYRATAGHPWLVQFIMKHIVDSFGSDFQRHDQVFEAIVTERFQENPEGPKVFGRYLESLRGDIGVLAHLALERQGSTLRSLAEKTGLTVTVLGERLEHLVNLGILYQVPGDTQDAERRHALSDIFRQWFLVHTGGTIFLAEIEQLRAAVSLDRTQVLNVPFTLTLGLNPDFLLAEGLYTRLIGLDRDFSESLNRIKTLLRTEGQKEILDIVADYLKKTLRQSEWEPIWNDYVQKARAQGRDPRFVLRAGDVDLFQFPIEILSFNGQPLGLETPVYKELMAGQRDPAYRLSRNLLPQETDLNVLIVGSGRGGELDGRHYSDLPWVDKEVIEIADTLLAGGSGQRLKIRKIVALVTTAEGLPEGIQRDEPSAENLGRALRGELGVRFHLLHYCGHYIPNRDERSGGLVLHDGESLELFNLPEWRNALSQTTLRLVCLSACATAGHVQAPNLYYLGAAREALTTGVPVVIGMRWSIKDVQGYDFSRIFYPQLVKSGIPELALFETRRKLHEEESGSSLWAAPVMLTR
jgi:hypothetical protein